VPIQVVVGLCLSLGGLAGLIVSLIFKLDAGVIAASTVMSTGAGFLGKEMFPQSPKAVETFSKRPPPPPPVTFTGIVLLIGLVPAAIYFAGCAGMDKAVADAQAARDRAAASAAAMRSDLSAARGVLDAFSTSVTVLCGFQRVEQCAAAEDTVRVLEAALKTASQAVDVAESAGIAMPVLAQQVATVAEQAKALGATVQALGEAVAYAVDEAKAPMAGRDGLAPLLQRAPESSAQPAPAGAP
jgi:hypothetical protein